uniref:Probable 2-oxoglutarate-dependent dioxygenase AOP1 n=1 Tax=Elaeis guineensis var. tenera TaxID=51953 RepID=A0A6J0PE01_ELAGV|nr:probable 2-oxoglutarate-dependent dioxygenase AOP1 [Elaeis guineensis]
MLLLSLIFASQTVWNFAKQVQKLEQMVERMVLQSLGVDKYWTSHTESLAHGVRLGEHGIPLDQETKIAMVSHVDPNMMTIICQHQVKGLEVQTKDGEWIDVEPLPNSFTVVIGEVFEAWTNGRLQPVHHRVRIHSNQKRHSALFGSQPKDGSMVRIPDR